MLDTPCSEVVWRVLTTDSIRQFPLHFPHRASPCAVTFQLDSTKVKLYTFLSVRESIVRITLWLFCVPVNKRNRLTYMCAHEPSRWDIVTKRKVETTSKESNSDRPGKHTGLYKNIYIFSVQYESARLKGVSRISEWWVHSYKEDMNLTESAVHYSGIHKEINEAHPKKNVW
jgi:hypothetical protein